MMKTVLNSKELFIQIISNFATLAKHVVGRFVCNTKVVVDAS